MSSEKMDNTLDSIRPSENLTQQAEMSYLFGRDPSILAYGQRPLLTDGSKKNLISLYDDEQTESRDTTSSLSLSSQTVKVYLRMKPYPKRMKLTEEQREAYTILNATTLLTKLPHMDTNTSCLKRTKSSDTVCRKFTFSQTFSYKTSQLELFEHAIKQQMIDFLAGQNATVMSYGTTNSGKSYTLQGTTVSPGIIPRSLEFVFSNIDPRSVPWYKPVHYCDVISLNSSERLQEMEAKGKILCLSSIDRNQCANTYKEMQKLLEQEHPKRQSFSVNAQYSVWVSFAEIYNETIYDLLSVDSQKRRIPLKLATDNHGRAFIKGLKTICVNSGSEAYQILMAGQYNLKVATTALNSRSSRSHCIFTIKLLKYYTENAAEEVELSTFSFCDLAGSERLKKTLNVGDRLKEAQNINTSLLVLGRCLKSIYEGQTIKQKQEIIGPFRESKLTRLFQKTLSGKEHLVLIVNVNPSPDLYIETQNVLSFSAIAKKIIIEPKEVKRKTTTSRFSQIVTQSIKTITDWDTTDLDSIKEDEESIAGLHKTEYIDLEDYEDTLNENEKLRKEIGFLRSSALNRDLQIRQEMTETFTAMMYQMEEEWKDRIKSVEEQQDCLLQWSVARTENFYKNKLVQLGKRKRIRTEANDDSDVEDNEAVVEELELENTRLKATIATLKKAIKELRESKDTLSADKSKAAFELAMVNEELKNMKNLLEAAQKDCNGEAHNYIAELKDLLAKKDEQIKHLKMFLNEAKEEYISITTDAREMQSRLKLQNETIVEHMDRIAELEEQLEHANIHLPEKTKALELLEERVEYQTKKLFDAENTVTEMQSTVAQLETDKIALMEELAKLQEIIIEHDKKSNPRSSQDNCRLEPLNIKYEIHDKVKSESAEEKVEDRQIDDESGESGESGESITEKNSELVKVEAENFSLREKLANGQDEIQLLHKNLQSTKVELDDIRKQLTLLTSSDSAKPLRHDVAIQMTPKNMINSHENLFENDPETSRDFQSKSMNLQKTEPDTTNQNNRQPITVKDMNIQTSFIEAVDDKNDDILSALQDQIKNKDEEFEKLKIKYSDLEERFQQNLMGMQESQENLQIAQESISRMKQSICDNEKQIKDYESTIKSLEEDLVSIASEKENIQYNLNEIQNIKESLDLKAITNENNISELEKAVKENVNRETQYTRDLEMAHEKLSKALSKEMHYEHVIDKLQKELSAANERYEIKAQCLEAYVERITKLEEDLTKATKLQEATTKEQEMESEIANLQKELKNMIRLNADSKTDQEMEASMKHVLKQLTETKEALERTESLYNETEKEKQSCLREIESMTLRLQQYEQNVKILDLLQQSSQERQIENERLRKMNDELKNSLADKDREMEAFRKNREGTAVKYDNLVKSQQEEIERQKREVMRYQELFRRQTPSKKEVKTLKDDLKAMKMRYEEAQERLNKLAVRIKDTRDNTSDDDVVIQESQSRRKPKKEYLTVSPGSNTEDITEYSGSESKRITRRTALPPPSIESTLERKRTTRKKKLFAQSDEACADIDPCEDIPPSPIPPPSTRSLRTRRK